MYDNEVLQQAITAYTKGSKEEIDRCLDFFAVRAEYQNTCFDILVYYHFEISDFCSQKETYDEPAYSFYDYITITDNVVIITNPDEDNEQSFNFSSPEAKQLGEKITDDFSVSLYDYAQDYINDVINSEPPSDY